MNAERLRAVVEFLLEIEKQANIQTKLEELAVSLRNLVGSPGPENQTVVSNQIEKLAVTVRSSLSNLNSAQRNSIADVFAEPYFSGHVVEQIKREMAQNAMTPAVVMTNIQELIDERKSFLNILRNTRSGLRNLGIEPAKLEPGQADIAVLMPRKLFHNDLDGLQKELKTLSSIIRTFYEISNVTPGPIEVKEISTSDPTFFLGIDVAPLIMLGLAIKWCIDVIKGSHDIKKIADNARKADVSEEIVRNIEEDIQRKIEAKLDQRVQEMLEKFSGDAGRRNELDSPTRFALNQLLQRIERGMVIEIHSNPPVLDANAEPASVHLKKQFEELNEIAASLEFPQIDGDPMLQLTTGDDAAKPASELKVS